MANKQRTAFDIDLTDEQRQCLAHWLTNEYNNALAARSALDVEVDYWHQLYEQARRDAFNRLADRDGLLVDAEPDQLGIALVNRYHAVKRAGKI